VSGFGHVYGRWLRDRTLSTIVWTASIVIIVVATAAFYPSLAGLTTDELTSGSEAMSSLLGLAQGIDPGSPLGYLWIALYANIFPWMLMALGIALGVAAVAGDEDTGTLEYLLSKPVTRSTVALARFTALVTILFVVSLLSALSLIVSLPLFDLDDSVTKTINGAAVTSPGATATDVFNGTFASLAVAMGVAGVAFLLGSATGKKGLALGAASGLAIGGYVLYTLANMTDSLEALTWLSPWRWYVDKAMLIYGLEWEVLLPFITATVGLLAGWFFFLRRDLQNP
jgi:ABC-2 type transport system permease protein